jgi:hypothetical protein
MEICMGSKDGPKPTLDGFSEQFSRDLAHLQEGWVSQLRSNPQKLGDLEREVHCRFAGFADQMVAGILDRVTNEGEFQTHSKNSEIWRTIRSVRQKNVP